MLEPVLGSQSANSTDEGMRHSIIEVEMTYDLKGGACLFSYNYVGAPHWKAFSIP